MSQKLKLVFGTELVPKILMVLMVTMVLVLSILIILQVLAFVDLDLGR